MSDALLNTLNSIVANATPLVIAGIGETITERAGVVNLSLNGSLLLSAMVGFAAATVTNSAAAGIAAAAMTGAAVALVLAFTSIRLRQDQIAVGFVLTLLCADLAKFLGKPIVNISGPRLETWNIPLLRDLPVVGPVLFSHDVSVYFGFVLVIATWLVLFRTRPGLTLRAIGERPEAAYARGAHVNQLRYFYTVLGGALIGMAGASYSLALKTGWSANPSMDGDGWIALAIVIFAGWHPARVVLGAYLLATLRAVASELQRSPDFRFPVVLLNTLPWLLMVGTLMLVSGGWIERLVRALPERVQGAARGLLRSNPPGALGTRFEGR
jgi:general nucleoside transport system permease protein